MFSSGVMMAMTTAVTAAETVDTCLKEPARAAAALRHFDRVSKHGPKEFSWFIHRVTNPAMRDLFMGPRNILRMKEALLGLLAGDIYGKTPIWSSLRAFKAVYYIVSVREPEALAHCSTAPAHQYPTRRARPDDRGLMGC